MRFPRGAALIAVAAICPSMVNGQDVAPIFESAPWIQYETYRAVDAPVFREYFEMLVDKFSGTEAFGWGVYQESPTVAYRITALPNTWQSLQDVNEQRVAGFEDFTEVEVDLFNRAWGSRHAALYAVNPDQSVVPEGFTVDDIRALPYNRVMVYRLKWGQAPAFAEALAARSALDREAGMDNFVFTVWWGGLGTETRTVMVRISAENRAADIAGFQSRQEARQAYMDEWRRLSGIMNAAAWEIEHHNQIRVADLSFAPEN
ncbi:MAG TPA: hypothetical protein DEF01_09770 [Gemmatimonadetes bacterium]|nr:hypothetical protein [Gemmatimonadota bacterium]|tara:strand:- start:3077 stop:3856 length:780 start_codon:yes stop_codon:yes gene_type:complete